jgi:hypothetical protein
MFELDVEKLKQLYKDFTEDSYAAGKKWHASLYRDQLGMINVSHLYYTILAHSRGRIHASRLGTRASYEQQAPVARPIADGSMKFNHVHYRRVTKETILTIDSLEAQAKFISPELLQQLTLDEAGKIRKRQQALQRGVKRLQDKLEKLEGSAPQALAAV